MGKYKNFAINLLVFFITTVATKLMSFILIPLYTYYLAASEYGITDMSATVITLVFPIATLSLADGVVRFVIDDTDNEKRYITASFYVVLLGCVVVALLLPLLDLSFFGGLGNYKALFYGAFVTTVIQSYFANVARALNKMKIIPWCATMSAVSTCLSAVLLIGHYRMAVIGYFYSIIFGQIVGMLMYAFWGQYHKYIRLISRKDFAYLKRMLAYSLPLVPDAVLWWMNTSINRFFITGMLGIAASGLFAAAQKIPNILSLFNNIFQQAWSLSAFQEFKKRDISGFFSVMFKLYYALVVSGSAVMIILAPWLASILLQKGFYSGWIYIPIMILAFYFNAFNIFYGSVFTTTMKTKYVMVTTFAGAVAVTLFTWLLIPVLGLMGAGIALVLSNVIVVVMRAVVSRRFLKFSVNWLATGASMALLIAETVVMTMRVEGYMLWSGVFVGGVIILQGLLIWPLLRKVLVRRFHRERTARA